MNKKDEFIAFVNQQCKILSESNIHLNPNHNYKYKTELLSFIQIMIKEFLQGYFKNLPQYQTDIKNIILSVKKSGKNFKYSYLRDLPVFKHGNVKTIEQWSLESKIIIFEDGEAYIMQYLESELVVSSHIDSVPKMYNQAELLDIINEIFKPIFQINLGNADKSRVIHEEILRFLPFKPHSNLPKEELKYIKLWEEYITRNYEIWPRRYTYMIKKIIIHNLSEYVDYYNEIPKWKLILHDTIKKISIL